MVLHIKELPKSPPVRATEQPRCRCRLEVLEEGGGREEDRSDEVGHVVGGGSNGVRVGREGTDCEARRANGEEDPDPPGNRPRRPPGRALRPRLWVLAMPTGFPKNAGAIGPHEFLARHEGTETASLLARPPSRGSQIALFHPGIVIDPSARCHEVPDSSPGEPTD